MFYSLGDVNRFLWIEVHRLTFVDSAKSAMPRTGVAAEHKCCGLISPAFKNVRAFCLLANGVQIETGNKVENSILVSRISEFYFQPIRFFQPLALLAVEKSLN